MNELTDKQKCDNWRKKMCFTNSKESDRSIVALKYKLCFYPDSSYVVTDSQCNENAVEEVCLYEISDDQYVLQCYDNGFVNKVSVHNILDLRKDYEYRNGIYKESNMCSCLLVDAKDNIMIISTINGEKYIKIIPVQNVFTHSSLGLKGMPVVLISENMRLDWYNISNTSRSHIASIIKDSAIGYGVCVAESKYQEEIQWIETTVLKKHITSKGKSISSSSSKEEEIKTYVDNNDYDSIISLFKSYKGVSVPKGQKLAKKIIMMSTSATYMWNMIKCLLYCDVNMYRKPIIDSLYDKPDLMSFKPRSEDLVQVVHLLFASDKKPSKSIDLIYPFRANLSEDAKNFIYKHTPALSNPLYYEKFLQIIDLSIREEVDLLINEAVPASYYRLYEILVQYKKIESKVKAKRLAYEVTKAIEDDSFKATLIKQLIKYSIYETGIYGETRILERIFDGGYNAYFKECVKKESKFKIQKEVKSLNEYVGKTIYCYIAREYTNYYVLSSIEGISAILPKECCIKKHIEGKGVNVSVIGVDTKNYTFFVSEKTDVTLNQILSSSLLSINDVIVLRISRFGIPINVQNCFCRVQVKVKKYPVELDVRKKYLAKVLKRLDFFTYEVELLKSLNRIDHDII